PTPGIEKYIKNQGYAELLGKALFWDMDVGSDGQACASCHFHAGADNRFKNQLSPGLLHTTGDKQFDVLPSGNQGAPNYSLTLADFPFYKFTNSLDRNSPHLFEVDDVVSSQGVFRADFVSLTPNGKDETCSIVHPDEAGFTVPNKGGAGPGSLNVRRVEPRNTPTVINAIFNFRNFWDGRANNIFNGVDPFGRRNPNAVVYNWDQKTRTLKPEEVHLINSSAASQAVGPVLSPFEMSCDNKGFHHAARKMLKKRALAKQKVAKTDSVLGYHVHGSGKGIKFKYDALVKKAFHSDYWAANKPVMIDGQPFTQMEANFSLFWGLAIQAYEATLVSDNSPFDRFAMGHKKSLTEQQKRGMKLFAGKGKCANCHQGPEFTKAGTTHLIPEEQEEGLVERMLMGDLKVSLYDNGFYNISVTPTEEDIGLGGVDPISNVPLSFTRQAQMIAAGQNVPDPFQVDPHTFESDPGVPVDPNERNAVDGAFKVPGLRNVALTGPYMHNGGMATLHQVVRFYNRGGNVESLGGGADSSGSFAASSNLDPDIQPLGLTPQEEHDLVAFMESLTDERVAWEKAPFDHPQLFVPNGSPGDDTGTYPDASANNLQGRDDMIEIPAVGRNGRSKGQGPLRNFLQ
ncbi:MAG: hypothetical protein OIF57_01275, partial [Marinobacterium sp.]|nr:hypothetical protein [Marinobacterium sp.]